MSLIVRVNVVLNRTVVVDSDWRFDNLCSSHLQSQSELYHVSWWYVVSLFTSRISVGRLTLRVSGDITSGEITFARLDRLLLTKHCDSRNGFSSTIPAPIGTWKNLDKNLTHKFPTLFPFIFMTGVQPPGPHPKSPIWQRTEVGVELKKSLTSWLRWDLHKSQGGHFGK